MIFTQSNGYYKRISLDLRNSYLSKASIDIVITCKGRLHHLKRSLPLAMAQNNTRCIVVDYSCPDFCGDWVESNFAAVEVVRVERQAFFNLCSARNAGAAAAVAPWLLFMDADILLSESFASNVSSLLQEGSCCLPAVKREFSKSGSFLCMKRDFEKTGGFDEVITGWGAEGRDFLERLVQNGIEARYFPAEWMDVIAHEDGDRCRFYEVKDLRVSRLINLCYVTAKLDIMRLGGQPPDLETRKNLYQTIRAAVSECISKRRSSDVRIVVQRSRLYGLEQSKVLHYHIDWKQGWKP